MPGPAAGRGGAIGIGLEETLVDLYGAIKRLEDAGVLPEVTGRQRGKLYGYDEYLAILNEAATDPPR